MKYFLKEYGKGSSIKIRRNRFLRKNEILVFYRIAEEANTALADATMYQALAAEIYRSTSKDEKNRVNEVHRQEQNKAAERSRQKGRKNTNTNEDNITFFTKEEIEILNKDLKYIKETLKIITSLQ